MYANIRIGEPSDDLLPGVKTETRRLFVAVSVMRLNLNLPYLLRIHDTERVAHVNIISFHIFKCVFEFPSLIVPGVRLAR